MEAPVDLTFGSVITGWDQGCLGMAIGEERELLIPAEEGYGAGGFPAWGIPPGGTLNFTLECLSVSAQMLFVCKSTPHRTFAFTRSHCLALF
jgi:FKBP-type peptidyl-prolyl cis-trans isomerase